MERDAQSTAAVLGFECSDDELRKCSQLTMKVAKGTITMSDAIVSILKDYDIPINADTKKAAGAAFLFTFGFARAIGKAEYKAEMGG